MIESNSGSKRVVLYARVSSDEQAERGTIGNQRDFLRNFASLYGLNVVDTYEDDGWSGTLALKDRAEGRRLLEDAEAHRFDEVVVYRIDRLARSLAALLDAHKALDRLGITLRSATEPFDTATSIGRFMFQLLGSLAELDRSSTLERLVQGRNRLARAGKWTGGVVPFGYDLDEDRCLTVSGRLVEPLRITEADLVRSVFQAIAGGSSCSAEALRLNTLGVPCARRYAGHKKGPMAIPTPRGLWDASRIQRMIRNTLYAGNHVFETRNGPIARDVPALVSTELWDAAGHQLTRNRKMSPANSKRVHLLRGLIECGRCGHAYVGNTMGHRGGKERKPVYRCGSASHRENPDLTTRCKGKMIPAEWLEDLVWQDCRAFILNPGEALAQAQQQLRNRMEQSTTAEAERHALLQRLNEYDGQRERIMTLFRRGRITLDEADAQLESADREATETRQMLDALSAQADLLKAWETRITDAASLLQRLQDQLDEVERSADGATTKRTIVEQLVYKIVVHTASAARGESPTITIHYAFTDPRSVAGESLEEKSAGVATSPTPCSTRYRRGNGPA
ncbi:MAG: hypothetical protein EPO21_18000 [Chloroflexota bacterium]|nr:MAG: hypothetical protein EPO21_18000 [Chloroflexota bacterium]